MLLLPLLWLVACNDSNEDSDPRTSYILQHSEDIDKQKVRVYTHHETQVGLNHVLIDILDANGDPISDLSPQISTLMDMGSMVHGGPVYQPAYNSEIGGYLGGVIFQMANTEMAFWEVRVDIGMDGITESIDFQPMVTTSNRVQRITIRDKKYIVTLAEPLEMKTGSNDIEYMFHYMASMMSFPALNNLQVTHSPYMDMGGGMGHDTPHSQPVFSENGIYEAEISFNMSGTWEVTVDFDSAQTSLGTVVFPVTVED